MDITTTIKVLAIGEIIFFTSLAYYISHHDFTKKGNYAIPDNRKPAPAKERIQMLLTGVLVVAVVVVGFVPALISYKLQKRNNGN